MAEVRTGSRSWRFRAAWAAGFILLCAAAAVAGPRVLELEKAGWKIWTLDGKKATRFTRRDDGAIKIVADRSFAMLFRRIANDQDRAHQMVWRWRVDETMQPTDQSRKGGDDRPIAVHLWFDDDPNTSSLWRRLKRTVARHLLGVPLPGRAITYVWGGLRERGNRIASPHAESDWAMIILRPGSTPTGRWFHERVDFVADFEKAFGQPPTAPMYIALSADSDDTASRSVALISDIAFSEK